MSPLPVALVQAAPVFLNLPASVDRALTLIEEAAREGARLIVFPETWLPGYPVWLDEAPGAALWGHRPAEALFRRLYENAPALDSPEIAALATAAAERGVDVVMGLHERAGASLYNTMAFIDADGGRRIHRKLTPTFNERLIWAQGDGSTLAAVERPYGKLGGLICWEHWMPLARAAMHAQHEAVHVAQWPAVTELHQIASRQYAFEGSASCSPRAGC
jgi:predicted amidohydrolase